ncbi:fasciclin domain-containing protein [Actinocorallia sp. A-T 12471]|uniref:fasciclin domain-containing protein n=1 Tax=Actinocorallia sp. A-T 12471 TaxID=3089813 RepID=UPI0029D27981|nr:fasciclin domain-containing protein [Actinocorallia sp. A-T 12471]MDX6738756.1 fasciclin domain-containing protein [Actinocorallia sp. A-T 12471]
MKMRQTIGAGAALVLGLGLTAVSAPTASAALAAEPFGDACSAVPQSGAGSLGEIANQPVATAASNLPFLSTLTSAVQTAGLTDTLNNAQALTVFAPTNDAFAAIPKEQLDKLLADKDALAKVLKYHVVEGEKTPDDLQNATLTTLDGGKVTTDGSDYNYTVNGSKVTCGDVPTANATVYVIDSVLVPNP